MGFDVYLKDKCGKDLGSLVDPGMPHSGFARSQVVELASLVFQAG
jgi:hypothetical protein